MQVQYSAAGNISYVPSDGYKRVKVFAVLIGVESGADADQPAGHLPLHLLLSHHRLPHQELMLISLLVIFPSIFYSLIIVSLTRS
jgi:hypothetical protein